MFSDVSNRRLMEVYAVFESLASRLDFTGFGVMLEAFEHGTDGAMLRFEGEDHSITLYEGLDKVAQISLSLTEDDDICLYADCRHGTLFLAATIASGRDGTSVHLSASNRDVDPKSIPRFARIVELLAAHKPLGNVTFTANRSLMKAALEYAMTYIFTRGTPLYGPTYLPDMLERLPWSG